MSSYSSALFSTIFSKYLLILDWFRYLAYWIEGSLGDIVPASLSNFSTLSSLFLVNSLLYWFILKSGNPSRSWISFRFLLSLWYWPPLITRIMEPKEIFLFLKEQTFLCAISSTLKKLYFVSPSGLVDYFLIVLMFSSWFSPCTRATNSSCFVEL